MARIYILAILITAVVAEEKAFPLTCEDMKVERNVTGGYFTDTGGNVYTPGEEKIIRLGRGRRGHASGTVRYMIQALKQGSLTETIGHWKVDGKSNIIPLNCDDENNPNQPDTVYSNGTVEEVSILWVAPKGDSKENEAVEMSFHVLFLDDRDNIHSQKSIRMIPRAEESDVGKATERPVVIDPDQDPHEPRTEDQLKMDAEKKKQEEIDQENLASEDDWSKKELEEIRRRQEEMHQEEMEYEENMRKEEEERLARIRAEIRDKVEYDRLLREREEAEEREKELDRKIENETKKLYPDDENEIDINEKATAGSSHVVGSVVCLLVVALQALL